MQTNVTSISTAKARVNANAGPMVFRKRIGSTSFVVAVHFSQSGKETIQDKILRLIESEARNNA